MRITVYFQEFLNLIFKEYKMAVTIGTTNITFNDSTLLASRTHPDYAGSYSSTTNQGVAAGSTFVSGATYRMMMPYFSIRIS
jgi:hypothetical protein